MANQLKDFLCIVALITAQNIIMANQLKDFPKQPEGEEMEKIEFGLCPVLKQDAPADAKTLYAAFDEDLTACENKYKGHRFEVSGVALKVAPDVHHKPAIELSDKVNGKCYVLCVFNSEDIFSVVKEGDTVVCRGNYLVASSRFGIVLKNSEVVKIK